MAKLEPLTPEEAKALHTCLTTIALPNNPEQYRLLRSAYKKLEQLSKKAKPKEPTDGA